MASILMVSKPVAPPWNDSSKNLVRDLAANLSRHRPTILTRRGDAPPLPNVDVEAVYAKTAAGFAPGLRDNAQVMLRLLLGRRHALWHFFFAPNPRTSRACAFAARVRGVPTVQTVCSAPAPGADLRALLFADRTIVLSRHTERLVLAAGLAAERVRRIAPAVSPLAPPSEAARESARRELDLPLGRPLVVYPGDLEFSGAAERTLRAHDTWSRKHDAVLVLACRAKTAAARAEDARLRALAAELGLQSSVVFLGETSRIHALLATADVVALPAENLYAKMDLPLVLIEAMWLARAFVCAAGTAAAELAEDDAGVTVAPDVDALTSAVSRLLEDPRVRVELGARARQAATERYHPAIAARAHDALYDELVR